VIGRIFAALALALALLGLGGAQAAQAIEVAEWEANPGSTIESETSVLLAGPAPTSVETLDLDFPIQAGHVVTFDYELLDGAVCSAGAPRVFLEVGGTYYNTWDLNPAQCGNGDNTVTYTFPVNGRVGAAGVVFDNVASPGSVRVSNLTIDGHLIPFLAPEPEPVVVELIDPSLQDATCGEDRLPAFLHLPEVEGLANYLVNDELHPNGTRVTVAEGNYLVEAIPADGYVLPDSYEGWRFSVEYPDCEEPTPTPDPTTPAPEPTETPAPSPTSSEPPSPSESPGTPTEAPDGGNENDRLPDTGANVTLLIAGAAMLVVGAAGLYLRHRRSGV
jgi:LPXTG-motif cell wall-anchored protein